MIDLKIRSIGRFSEIQSFFQTTQCPWLNICFSGLKISKHYHPNGDLLCEIKDTASFIQLIMPQTKIYSNYSKSRENWVIMFEHLPLRFSPHNSKLLEININDTWINAPYFSEIHQENIPQWRNDLISARELTLNPTHFNHFKSKTIILKAILDLLEPNESKLNASSPASALKTLIDKDTSFSKTIYELCEICNYSSDHIRTLFQTEFNISPQQYRNDKRLAFAFDYISQTDLSVKEIAQKLGFKHPSNLCKVFKNKYDLSPGDAIKKFRQP